MPSRGNSDSLPEEQPAQPVQCFAGEQPLFSRSVRGVLVAKGPRSSLRGTVPQGVMLDGPEEGVVEVGQDECHGVEINVEDVEEGNNKDDCMVGRLRWIFVRATPSTSHHVLSRVVWCSQHGNTHVWVCTVCTPCRLQWISSTVNQIQLQRRKN